MQVLFDSITDISYTTARAYATIIDPGDGIEQHGHCWSTSAETISVDNENKTENGNTNSAGSYTSDLTGLVSNTTYYIRAYVLDGPAVVFSDKVLSFNTLTINTPDVLTGIVTNITTTGATVSGDLNSIGSGASSVTQHGHCWSGETATPTVGDDSKSSLGPRDSTGSFESNLVGLSENTLYYVRAYATNEAGTAYGDTISFTTEKSIYLPSVTTASVSSVTTSSAICGGDISTDGGSPVTAKGVCWDTIINPNTSDNHTNDGSGSDAFVSEITGLEENATYYVRAYATNNAGTGYGSNVSFTTEEEDISTPTVTTTEADNITDSSAVSGGNVTSDGGGDVTARGVCWNTTGNPVTSDDHTTDGSGTGIFTSSITGLSVYTAYYARAYATNSEGTAYGNQISFTTNALLPGVTTAEASNVTEISAESGGNVISEGGATVTAYGVCWSTSENPEITDDKTTDGIGSGSFTSDISGLSPGTTYYVRAYATNIAGTAYGDQISFTTGAYLPTVSTVGISSVTVSSAQCGGNVTSDGGAIVTVRGVCWSTSKNPEISDDKTIDGSGTGSYTSNISGLSPATTYYVRAYATNSEGTAYGLQDSLFTFWDNSTISDYDGNVYNTVQIGTQIWMAENLNTTRYKNGGVIPLVTDNAAWESLNTHAYCWYENDEATYGSIYGALYNWYTIITDTLCPTGWHVPTDNEWTILEIYVDGDGGKLKETGTVHWFSPNEGATNETGFTALPGGLRFYYYEMIRERGFWWTSTQEDTENALNRVLRYGSSGIGGLPYPKYTGQSIRCIRD
ncbi:MAG: fibrobacter succinogenes major paralogous domain-containing protein [Bacteroidales bacterium]|nr:MAG: fibrobacter succinogenes major paralogous domain-containing protein [Bacteroidales bacterium]